MTRRRLPINTTKVRNIVDNYFKYNKFNRLIELEQYYYNIMLNIFVTIVQDKLISGEECPYLGIFPTSSNRLTVLFTNIEEDEYTISTELIVLYNKEGDRYYLYNTISIMKHEAITGIGYLKTFGELGIILRDYAKTHKFITDYATRIGLILLERFSVIDDIETIMRKVAKRILRREKDREITVSGRTLLTLRRLLGNLN